MTGLYSRVGGFVATGSNQGGTEIGPAFHVNVDQDITGLTWYRASTATGLKPDVLRLWDYAAQTEIARSATVADNGAQGWQDSAFDAGLTLTANTVYAITAEWQTSIGWPQQTGPFNAASPFAFETNFRRYHTPIGATGFPQNADSGGYVGLDVVLASGTGGTGGTGGASLADIEADLAAWLSSLAGTNAHQDDGLPWQTKQKLDATALVSAAIKNGLDIVSPQIGSIWALAGNLTDLELAAIRSFWKAGADRITGPNGGGGSAFYTSSGTLTSSVTVANQDTLTFMRRPLDDFPTSYTLVDERDYTGAIIWTVDADVFVHQITAWPDTASSEDVAGRTKLPYAGWWAPQAVSLPQARRFLEFDQQLCEWLPRRMKGGIFNLKDGYSGHVQALTHV